MSKNKQEIYKFLNENQIPYEVIEHEPVYTIQEMIDAGIMDKGEVCKNLFLRDAKGKTHYLVILPGEKRADLKQLAELLGSSRLSFASEKRLKKYLHLSQGSVSPLGILNDETSEVIVVMDNALKKEDKLGVHPNDNTATLWLKYRDLYSIIQEHGNTILTIDL